MGGGGGGGVAQELKEWKERTNPNPQKALRSSSGHQELIDVVSTDITELQILTWKNTKISDQYFHFSTRFTVMYTRLLNTQL